MSHFGMILALLLGFAAQSLGGCGLPAPYRSALDPLALQAMSFQLTWCSDTADLTLIRTATTSVGTRRQTVHVAD